MATKHGWEDLRERGDLVFMPGVSARQVSHLARAHVRRRLGPRAVVTTITAVEGAFVLLTYVPPKYVERAPRTEDPEPPEPRSPARPAKFRDPATSWQDQEPPDVEPDEPEEDLDGSTGIGGDA